MRLSLRLLARTMTTLYMVWMAFTSAASASLRVDWMRGFSAPGTPAKYDKVGVIKIGPERAKNVLVLEPGTSAGSAYFVPLARWIVSRTTGWQVWSVERRENLLEDQSELDLAKTGKASAAALFDYYLGWITNPAITRHFQFIPTASVGFAKQWGMNVAVQDLHQVIEAAGKLGGKVVLGGHSLGGAVVTAYASWNFHGHAGADELAGLVYIDGGSPPPVPAHTAAAGLRKLDGAGRSPWLSFGGIGAPYAGLFEATGSTAALIDPNATNLAQASGLLPADLVPPVPVTNLGQYGYALNVKTSPMALAAAQAHLGQGVATTGHPRGWNGRGALTPISRFATMFSGFGVQGADGSEWYFPERLTLDTGAVDNGNVNPAQAVLQVKATLGRQLPKDLLIYAFGARLGGQRVLTDAVRLAQQSHIPMHNLTLINRQSTYAHNDPAGAYPQNVFFAHLLPFLGSVSRTHRHSRRRDARPVRPHA
jgi:pimeloyl-ACP methyl ester carboxylesterase